MMSGRRLALALAFATVQACGGGGGSGSDDGVIPPPGPPPVFMTPTAVRVSRATPFSGGCLATSGTIYTNAEAEAHLAIDPTNPNHLIATWQQDRLSDGGALGNVVAASVDGGITWSAPRAIAFSQCAGGPFARASDPWVSINGVAAFHAGIAFTGATLGPGSRSAVLVARSTDGGFNWSAPIAVADDDGALYFNDKETLTADPYDPRYVYAVWDRLDTADRGPTRLARSQDGGLSWAPAVTIYDPGPDRQTIGNVIVVAPGRRTYNFFTELAAVPGDPTRTTGRLAVQLSLDHGLSWSAPTQIAELLAVGTRDPARPDATVRAGEILGNFAADPRDGSLYAVWQDSRFSGGSHNAIVLAASHDGGATWSTPVRVNAEAGVAAFTPSLAVLPDGSVGVSYYDFRSIGTATTRPTDYWLAVSRNGVAWRETRLAGNFDLLNAPNARGLFVGDYQGLAGSGSVFNLLYVRTNNADTTNRTDAYADRVDGATLTSGMAQPFAADAATHVPPLSASAQRRVEQHLAAQRVARHELWQALQESAADQP